MSSQANLKINFLPESASKEEALNVLLELCDDDFNGKNGKDYIRKDALESGYSSNAEYYFEGGLISGLSSVDAIQETLKTQYESDSYYYDYEIEIMSHEAGHFIATSYITQ